MSDGGLSAEQWYRSALSGVQVVGHDGSTLRVSILHPVQVTTYPVNSHTPGTTGIH